MERCLLQSNSDHRSAAERWRYRLETSHISGVNGGHVIISHLHVDDPIKFALLSKLEDAGGQIALMVVDPDTQQLR